MVSSKIGGPPSEAPPSYDETESVQLLSSQLAGTQISELHVRGKVPNVSQTICHLKLLHAFSKLRDQVSNTDGLFGLFDVPENEHSDDFDDLKHARALLRLRIKEKRWAVYVQRAADRFANWWNALKQWKHGGTLLQIADLLSEGRSKFMTGTEKPSKEDPDWIRGKLPPLDVLMVWHAFMLNPHDYLEDCLRHRLMSVWHSGMPWQHIDSLIDIDSGAYVVSEDDQRAFEMFVANNGMSTSPTLWNNLDDDPEKILDCPLCDYEVLNSQSRLRVPWTTSGAALAEAAASVTRFKDELPRNDNRQQSDLALVDRAAESGQGYADVDIANDIDARQFLRDAITWKIRSKKSERILQWEDAASAIPMKGTLLNDDGIPKGDYCAYGAFKSNARNFPNRIVGASMTFAKPAHLWPDMKRVRDEMQIALADLTYVGWALQTHSKRLPIPRSHRVAIRRMMSHYWSNSSPFCTDLAAAVIRQGSFIAKMQDIDWLHSPAIASTMSRLIQKYERFVQIMGTYKSDMAVPTLDVDLAWHTHQLAPSSYYSYTTVLCGKFIDHDDKVGELKLSDSFAKTSARYQKMFNAPYSECTCWYCEAIRAEHTSSLTRTFKKDRERSIQEQLHDCPENGNHISSHGVIRPVMDSLDERRYTAAVQKYETQLRSAWEKACKRARKEGRTPPEAPRGLREKDGKRGNKKDGAAASDARLYGLYMYPYPVGFMPLPYATPVGYCPGMYAGDPGCASTVHGAAGNCASGTCGGGVAAGGAMCGAGGASVGGCAGGSGAGVGGCGGGGGGGGGCGGGGGGCGGGGGG
ncbi:MAG: hypothetical protein Q9159_005192 [Coniocarpon cinnabarinum]